jgi:hypothetical protein
MAKWTIEVHQIYEIITDGDEYWGDVLDKAQETYYKTGVEIDAVTLLNANNEVIDVVATDEEEINE